MSIIFGLIFGWICAFMLISTAIIVIYIFLKSENEIYNKDEISSKESKIVLIIDKIFLFLKLRKCMTSETISSPCQN